MNWRSWIAKNRKNPMLRLTASVSGKFLRAYDNQCNWDIHSNGEYFIAKKLSDAAPGIIFDVGANIGAYAKMAISLSGVTELHAFEISPPTFKILYDNCSELSNIRLNPFGLGAEAGVATIHHAPDSSDRTSLFLIDDGFSRKSLAAELRTGDGYMHDAGINEITLLKIDVEGADLDVLRGFSSSFDNQRVTAVQFEHGGPSIESRTFLRDKIEYLQGFGFSCFRLYPGDLERNRAMHL